MRPRAALLAVHSIRGELLRARSTLESGGPRQMNFKFAIRRAALAAVVLGAAGLLMPAIASAHARVSPAVSLANKLQLYSLAVPTEKDGITTTKLVMTVPGGFTIDSYVQPATPWHVTESPNGSQVTLSGGSTPTGQDTLFQFLGQPA